MILCMTSTVSFCSICVVVFLQVAWLLDTSSSDLFSLKLWALMTLWNLFQPSEFVNLNKRIWKQIVTLKSMNACMLCSFLPLTNFCIIDISCGNQIYKYFFARLIQLSGFVDFVSFLIYLAELSAGGVTSRWFCLESSVLTLAISYAALSFYRDRTYQKARRMFHASLLYLPVFMSGLLLHRLPDNQQCVQEESSEWIVEPSSSLGTLAEESENDDWKNTAMRSTAGKQARPPVAYASVAPFPFLPAPLYTAPWCIVHLDFVLQ